LRYYLRESRRTDPSLDSGKPKLLTTVDAMANVMLCDLQQDDAASHKAFAQLLIAT
jgi:hypothetical protein